MQLVKDREILASELLSEFTDGFVYKQSPFREVSEKSTQTLVLRHRRRLTTSPRLAMSPYHEVNADDEDFVDTGYLGSHSREW